MNDDVGAQHFFVNPPLGKAGERYKVVCYLSPDDRSWDQGLDPPTSDDDEDWIEHRLLVACEAGNVADLLSRLGDHLATAPDMTPEKAHRMIMSGEDNGDWFSCTNQDTLAYLRTIDDPGRRIAAFHLLEAAPFTFERKPSEDDEYLRYVPAAFPGHEFVAAWTAAPPHQDEAYAILREVKKRPRAGATSRSLKGRGSGTRS
jgi:hypothetical protein